MIHAFRLALFGCAVGALALSGCSSASNTTPSSAPCTLPTGAQIALVYPAPGTTGNTTQLAQVIIASNVSLPSGFDVVLTYAPSGVYGAGQFGGFLVPTSPPFPSPSLTPTIVNPFYYSSGFNVAFQALPPGNAITVNYNNVNSSCNPAAFASFGT